MDVSVALTLVQTVLQLLDSHIWMKIESVSGVESQLVKLKSTMSTINAIFLDAEEQERLLQYRRSHVELDRLERLKEAVYQANDLFDKVSTLAHRRMLMPGNRVSKEVCLFFSRSNQLSSAFSLSREIIMIREMLDNIVKDYQFSHSIRHEVSCTRKNLRETHSFVCEEDVIIGRDDDKRMVVDMLLETPIEEDVSVIGIVGIGGLGKTTLAQLVYNDDMIDREFQLKMWVYVSADFNVHALLGKILAAATKQTSHNGLCMDQLQTNLRQELDGKKYLLVLDDIWNEDFNEWLKLRNLLRRGGQGSKIIVTTRSREVAKTVGCRHTHELEGLSEEDSWKLFERMILEPGQHHMEARLVDIGKEIVRKCANVPLAIRVVGSLLRGKEETKWHYLKKIDLSNIKQDHNGIVPVLKISYYYLPYHLKSCFSYCAIFPKNYKIDKEDLICLWMAQGFIMPLDGESFEAAGEEYFMTLLQRCFFQNVERNDSGEILSCKMHDLIHDLAKEVAGTEILSSNYNTSCFNEKTHHIFIDSTVKTTNVGSYLTQMKRLRTILHSSTFQICSYIRLPKVRFLRVLDLHSSSLKTLPSTIGELLHLRYIDLSGNAQIRVLPASITELFNLQTVKLQGCRSLKVLPRDLSKLINLRYLDVCGCSSLTHMPPGMNGMTCLHKLTMFVLSDRWRPIDIGGLADLKCLTNLTGSIDIKLRRGSTYNAAKAREGGYLINKPDLRSINIYWNSMPGCAEYFRHRGDDTEGTSAQALLQGLQPHPNLRMLELWCYPGARLPTWGGSSMNLKISLPNLVEIRFVGCLRLEQLPSLSQLRHLRVLQLSGLRKLDYVECSSTMGGAPTSSGGSRQLAADEVVFFPSLEKLELNWLAELKGWWKALSHSDSGEGEMEIGNEDHSYINNEQQRRQQYQLLVARLHSYSFPKLSHMQIEGCPNLASFPRCPKLEVLEIRGFNEAVGAIIGVSVDALHSSSSDNKLQGQQQGRLGYLNSQPMESFQRLSHLVIECDLNIERLTAGEVFQSRCLSSLRSLVICRYWKLKSLSGQGVWEHLTALESLRLSCLYELDLNHEDLDSSISTTSYCRAGEGDRQEDDATDADMPWRLLGHSLRSVELWHLPKLVKLPTGMHHLTSLQSLDISSCDNLEQLPSWIGCLSSLQFLSIRDCKRLKAFPERVCQLTSLRRLDIWACSPELKERCMNPTGVDWPKIQHIPHISVSI